MLHNLPLARDFSHGHAQGWMPTFRTGGGFSLTQRSPRPRAAHDNLPPPGTSVAQPRFLADLLEKMPESKPMSPRLQDPVANTPTAGRRGHSTLNLELPLAAAGASGGGGRVRGIGSAPAGIPDSQHLASRRPPSSAPTAGAGASSAAAGTVPPPAAVSMPTSSAPTSARRRGIVRAATPAAPPACFVPAEPARRGLQGFTPRHSSDHPRSSASSGPPPPPPPRDSLDEHTYSIHPSSPPPRAALGSASGSGGSGVDLLPQASVASILPLPSAPEASVLGLRGLEAEAVTEVAAEGSAGASGATTGAAQGQHAVAYVPIPSMRHAHHLASLSRPAVGPRLPPSAPAARDESAVHRVSNYSIRPRLHDADLSARFGAKAACRAPSPTGAPDDAVVGTIVGPASLGLGSGASALGLGGICGEPPPTVRREVPVVASPRAGSSTRPPRVTVTATESRVPPAPSPANGDGG